MLVDCTSKLRLGLLLDENTERNFSLSHLFGGRSLFGGVDIARVSVIDVIDEISMKLELERTMCVCLYNHHCDR